MKKTITILMMLIVTMSFSQTNITSVLDDLQWDLRLGCCATDEDNHPDFPDCTYPDYQEYYTNGDVNINQNHLRISNASLVVKGNFFASPGKITFSENCESTLVVEGNLFYTNGSIDIENEGLTVVGNIIEMTLSLMEFSKTLNKGEIFIVYNSLGQMLKTGSYNDVSDLYSNELRFIRFPKLNYSSKMILKTK